MAKYRKRPVIVEADQWFPGTDVPGVQQEDAFGLNPGQFYVVTIHGQRAYLTAGDWVIAEYLTAGDWVIDEPDGIHHYPCKPDIFALSYEKI